MTRAKTNRGLDRVRDFLLDDAATVVAGTDGTEPSTTDTQLGAEVAAKPAQGQRGAVGEVTHRARLLVSDANGSTLREVGLKDAASGLTARIVHAAVEKTVDFEVEYWFTEKVRNV